MKHLIAFVFTLFTFSAFGQYSCEELPELRRTLAELTRDCGGVGRPVPDHGICHAQVNSSRYPGSSVDEAIKLCVRAGWQESTCSKRVVCEGLRRSCYSQVNSDKYPGRTVEEAIQLCKRAGWQEETCSKRVVCEGFQRLCHARVNSDKYPGTTVDEAIALCQRAGWSEHTCAQNVSCQ